MTGFCKNPAKKVPTQRSISSEHKIALSKLKKRSETVGSIMEPFHFLRPTHKWNTNSMCTDDGILPIPPFHDARTVRASARAAQKWNSGANGLLPIPHMFPPHAPPLLRHQHNATYCAQAAQFQFQQRQQPPLYIYPQVPIYARPKKLYHYTTRTGLEGILRDQNIRVNQSSSNRYGHGIYFTELPPESSTYDIMQNNFIHTSSVSHYRKTEACLEFLSARLPNLDYVGNQCGGRNVWMSRVVLLSLSGASGIYHLRELDGNKAPKDIMCSGYNFRGNKSRVLYML